MIGREGRLGAWRLAPALPRPGRAQSESRASAAAHKGAIDACQRNDIADGRQPHEIERCAQIRLGDAAFAAYQPRSRKARLSATTKEKRHARGAEMSEAGCVAGLIGDSHAATARRRRLDRVMIEHDDIEPDVARGRQRLDAPRRRNRP